ncbi:protein C1orf194-like [Amphibalanus amphitrite]|uniref:protein C1orf194-like n=1 Tax=Amphibalanus amphitrite TaxID=1232801 RepID=UPI001C92A30F|nr:protein C1orf194-like [Amphibalanus amphitrite]
MWQPVPPNKLTATSPWERLHKNCTLSSHRHSVYHSDPQAPLDALDFEIKAIYDQATGLFTPKHLVLVQHETCGDGDRSKTLKHRVKYVPLEQPLLGHPLRVVEAQRRIHPCSVRLACENPHTTLTNAGFSRKPNGGTFAT